MRQLSRFIVTRRVWVLIATAVLAVASAVVGGGVADKLSLGGTEDPASESVVVQDELLREFVQARQPDFVLVVTARDGDVDDPAVVAVAEEIEAELAREDDVVLAQSYWSIDAPPLKSTDGSQALVLAALAGDETERIEVAERLTEDYFGRRGPVDIAVTGASPIEAQISVRAEKDLHKTELLTAPLVFIALVLVFGSLVAAFLPLVVGVLAILGTFVVLTVLAGQTTVSVFALNLTTALGLGLAIDYSLFIVSRYREELDRGVSQLVAVGRTMQTAGRTVAFSAGTVMISLAALVLFPMPYLRSFAFAGVAVVGLAALVSILVLARVDAVTGTYGLVPDDELATVLPTLPGVEQFDDERFIVPAAIVGPERTTERFTPIDEGRGTWMSVVPDVEPFSDDGEQMVHDIRDLSAPFDFGVTGSSARLVDTSDSVFGRLALVLIVVAVATFVLLFLMTGSLLVPLKALVMNVLSLTATFGAMVWIFQDGNLSGLLGFEPTGTIDTFMPVLMFCIAFGLSMDYEVFLISRIKEEYDLDRDNEESVRVGLGKTGRIVTAAAWLLAIVFIGIATSDVAILKLFGVGVTLAVLVDAFLIRATLVPAFMRLAGRLNWWAPTPLRRFHLRWGIWEHEPIAVLDRVLDPDS